jgi:hypothetical protein
MYTPQDAAEDTGESLEKVKRAWRDAARDAQEEEE